MAATKQYTAKQEYTAKQVGALCGLTKVTIHEHRKRGIIKYGKLDKVTGTYKFPRHAVSLYLFEQHGIKLEDVE
jgi:hypothetical protein